MEHDDDGTWDDLIGKPYRLGCIGPDYYDCFGLVATVLTRLGFIVDFELASELIRQYQPGDADPSEIIEPATDATCESDTEPRRPGDLIVMRGDGSGNNRATHVAVHIGENMVLQATRALGVHVVPYRVLMPQTVEVITWKS